jgi:DNA-binding CsgD family transcriptional regulator
MGTPYVERARAWVTAAGGELSRARQIARDHAENCASYDQIMFDAFAWHTVARLGDPAGARQALAALAPRVDGELIPAFAAHSAALAEGDADELDRVAMAFERMGAVLYAAEAAAAAARLFRREGKRASALGAAARARVLADQCEGARTPALELLDASLPLTAREREVAGLAARGLSNREIAAHLVVSVRTVDNHLHNAYTKLGITQRSELAAILLPGSSDGQHL